MKIQGKTILPAPPEEVFAILTDPVRLAKLLPGCERLEPVGKDEFSVIVKFGIAAISGKYSGKVALMEKKPPYSWRMKVEGKGAPGFMRGEGAITLKGKRAETEVHYEGEAHVGGLVASMGQRMIEGAAKRIIQQFFESAAAQLKSASEKK